MTQRLAIKPKNITRRFTRGTLKALTSLTLKPAQACWCTADLKHIEKLLVTILQIKNLHTLRMLCASSSFSLLLCARSTSSARAMKGFWSWKKLSKAYKNNVFQNKSSSLFWVVWKKQIPLLTSCSTQWNIFC